MATWKLKFGQCLIVIFYLIVHGSGVKVHEGPRTNPASLHRRQSNNTDLISSGSEVINIVMLISEQNELPVYYEILKPTLDLALKEVAKKYSHLTFNLVPIKDQNKCADNVVGALAAEKFYTSKVNAFIGPICTIALDPVARMASYWNVPVFTAGGIGAEFSNKRTFTTLSRVSFSLGIHNS